MMGSDKGNNDQSPVHEVFLDAFYIDIFEVTNGRYMECVNAGICEPPSSNGSYTQWDYYDNPEFIDYPVIYISWSDAQTYCEWRGARLPTEAEWEVAARGGLHGKLYPWGDESPGCYFYLPNGAKFNDDWVCKKSDTESVGSYQSNGYGLYDMAGNVLEWVADWYESNYYSESPFENPPGPTSGVQRVTRGGSWNSDWYSLQISFRNRYDPSTSSNFIGFRCARSP